jgi:hypothetical protein
VSEALNNSQLMHVPDHLVYLMTSPTTLGWKVLQFPVVCFHGANSLQGSDGTRFLDFPIQLEYLLQVCLIKDQVAVAKVVSPYLWVFPHEVVV